MPTRGTKTDGTNARTGYTSSSHGKRRSIINLKLIGMKIGRLARQIGANIDEVTAAINGNAFGTTSAGLTAWTIRGDEIQKCICIGSISYHDGERLHRGNVFCSTDGTIFNDIEREVFAELEDARDMLGRIMNC